MPAPRWTEIVTDGNGRGSEGGDEAMKSDESVVKSESPHDSPSCKIEVAEQKRLDSAREAGHRGRSGAHISASDSGAQSAKTIAKMVTLGISSPTTRRAPVRIAGAKTV